MLIDVSDAKVHSSFGMQTASFFHLYSLFVLCSNTQSGELIWKWISRRFQIKTRSEEEATFTLGFQVASFHQTLQPGKIHWRKGVRALTRKIRMKWQCRRCFSEKTKQICLVSFECVPLEAESADRRTGYRRFFEVDTFCSLICNRNVSKQLNEDDWQNDIFDSWCTSWNGVV